MNIENRTLRQKTGHAKQSTHHMMTFNFNAFFGWFGHTLKALTLLPILPIFGKLQDFRFRMRWVHMYSVHVSSWIRWASHEEPPHWMMYIYKLCQMRAGCMNHLNQSVVHLWQAVLVARWEWWALRKFIFRKPTTHVTRLHITCPK